MDTSIFYFVLEVRSAVTEEAGLAAGTSTAGFGSRPPTRLARWRSNGCGPKAGR